MASQQLVDYIKSQLVVGVTKDDLRKAIADAGWTAADAQAAFDVVEGKVHAAPVLPLQPQPVRPQPTPLQPLQPAQPLRPIIRSRRPMEAWAWWLIGIIVVLLLAAALVYFVPTLRTIAAWYLAGMPAPATNVFTPVQEMPGSTATTTQSAATSTVATTTALTTSSTSSKISSTTSAGAATTTH